MRLEIHESEIGAYVYRDREDLTEVVLEDTCRKVGEGAFAGCRSLKKLTVGRGIEQVSMRSFAGLAKNIQILWLTKTPYKSMLYAILPDTDQIALICAPYRPFTTAAGKEKAALACGYLLHPEYKEEFGPQRQEAYEVFLKEEFAGYMNRLLETELIVDVTEALWRREIVRDPQIIQQYISYARTRITNRNEKNVWMRSRARPD